MSALGQKQTLPAFRAMSAIPAKADIAGVNGIFAKCQQLPSSYRLMVLQINQMRSVKSCVKLIALGC